MPPDPNIPLTFNSDGTFNLCDEGLYGIAETLYATFDSYAIDPTQTPPTIVHRYVSPHVYKVDPLTGATTVLAETDWQLSAIVEAGGKSMLSRPSSTASIGVSVSLSRMLSWTRLI